jgi:hypothetical protein
MTLALVLPSLLAFQIKHYFCDFVLQTKWQIMGKKVYGGPGGLLHAFLHAVASVPPLYLLGVPLWMLVAAPIGELVLHYHIDWAKSQIDERFHLADTESRYWIVFGFDQLLHQLTYLVFVAWWAGAL